MVCNHKDRLYDTIKFIVNTQKGHGYRWLFDLNYHKTYKLMMILTMHILKR